MQVGRVSLPLLPAALHKGPKAAAGSGSFSRTGCAMRTMEKVAAGLATGEAVLLVGETGTGEGRCG
jgi:midasin (ATPase involved in ribosome maturation)